MTIVFCLIVATMLYTSFFNWCKGYYPFNWTIITQYGWYGVSVAYAPWALYNDTDDTCAIVKRRYILSVHTGFKTFDLFPVCISEPCTSEDLY